MDELLRRLAEIHHLNMARAIVNWDELTYMPPGGAAARARLTAALTRLAHEKLTDPEIGRLLDRLQREVEGEPPEHDGAALLRIVRREYERAVKLPADLVTELAEASSAGYQAWVKAREERNFSLFQDSLARIVDLVRRKAEALGYTHHPYDALLDEYEPGLTTEEVARLFSRLREDLVPLVRAITDNVDAVDDRILKQPFPENEQWALAEEALRLIGFDFSRGRQDATVHPFCTSFSPNDVRLTTRVDPNCFSPAFFAALHEGGHGLYEQGLPIEHEESPLGQAISLGIHESQSRLWENLVGRSRAFWRHMFPRVQSRFPSQLAGANAETMYRAVNRVEPSFIRVEADEVTYNLHIMLRFDLEKQLLGGALEPAQVPEAWNAKMEEYLGITPRHDADGVLQDVHWSHGLFGYFPTYTLGNVLAVQFYEAALEDRPGIRDDVEKGDYGSLLQWLRHHIHRHGSRYLPGELVQKATGRPMDPEPFLMYIRRKYGELYGVEGALDR